MTDSMTPQEAIDNLAQTARRALAEAADLAKKHDISFSVELVENLGTGIGYVDGKYRSWQGTLDDVRSEAEDQARHALGISWGEEHPLLNRKIEEIMVDLVKDWHATQGTQSGTLRFDPNYGWTQESPWVSSSLNC